MYIFITNVNEVYKHPFFKKKILIFFWPAPFLKIAFYGILLESIRCPSSTHLNTHTIICMIQHDILHISPCLVLQIELADLIYEIL